MDGYGLTIVVDDDDFKEPAGSVGADVEVAGALVEHTDGIAHRVLDVQVTDAVLPSGARDLHECKLPCPSESWQVTLLAILGYARFAPSARTSMPN